MTVDFEQLPAPDIVLDSDGNARTYTDGMRKEEEE